MGGHLGGRKSRTMHGVGLLPRLGTAQAEPSLVGKEDKSSSGPDERDCTWKFLTLPPVKNVGRRLKTPGWLGGPQPEWDLGG